MCIMVGEVVLHLLNVKNIKIDNARQKVKLF